MPTVCDVAAYILAKSPPMTAMKLQKLVYYCQAWSLVWDEEPLFPERIEAWANGPVVPELYQRHRGRFKVHDHAWTGGNPKALNRTQRETVNAVLKFYVKRTARHLSDLTHSEDPWREARIGLPPTARSNREITHASMAEYYGSL